MISKALLVWLGLSAAAGGVAYHTSYKAQGLEEQLATIHRKIVTEQETIQVLKAEWSFLNDPTRLETMAKGYLALRPTDARQFIASATIIPMRPEPVAPVVAPATPTPASAIARMAPGAPAQQKPAVAGAVMTAALGAPSAGRPTPQGQTQVNQGRAQAPSVIAAPPPQTHTLAAAPRALPLPTRSAPKVPVGGDSIGVMIARLGGAR